MDDFLRIYQTRTEEKLDAIDAFWHAYKHYIFSSTSPQDKSRSASIQPSEITDLPINPIEHLLTDFSKERSSSRDFSLFCYYTQIYSTSTENLFDLKSIIEQEKEFANTLLQLIREEIFEFGMENAADVFVQEKLRKTPAFTKGCLNKVFLKYFSDIEITTGILRIISHINYEDIYPTGQTMALSALIHENNEIQECGIRAFENWGEIESLDYLKHVQCKEKWLQDYLDKVISYLEEYHVSTA